MMLKAELKVVGGKQSGNRIALPPKFLIGREQDCQLRPSSDLVSRHHCMFTLDDYTLRLRDLGSTNGTLVNNELLDGQVVLKNGDNVRVGNLEFEVIIHAENSPKSDNQDYLADEDSRIIPSGAGELPTSETLVDVVLPHGLETEDEKPTESFAGGAEASGSDTNTMPTYPQAPPAQQPGWPAGMPPQGYYPPPPGYYPPQGIPYPPPGYPQYYPQQPGYAPQQQAPPEAAPVAPAIPDIRLPDPSETGVKEVDPAMSQGSKGDEPNPSDKANELLNKMRTRR